MTIGDIRKRMAAGVYDHKLKGQTPDGTVTISGRLTAHPTTWKVAGNYTGPAIVYTTSEPRTRLCVVTCKGGAVTGWNP